VRALTNPGLDLQYRVESTRAGRLAISAFVVAVLATVAVANFPAGAVHQRGAQVTQPFANALGLDQKWRMFAPIPRNEVIYLEARVRRADGTVSVWRPPTNGPLVGAYRDYHWRKLVEHAVPGGDAWPGLWRPIALYAAREEAVHGSAPVSVTLVKRSADILPPDRGGGLTPFREQPYLTVGVSP
jgi:hypothetical protein